MKKWILVILLLLFSIFLFCLFIPKKEKLVREKIEYYNTELNQYFSSFQDFLPFESGAIHVRVDYKGAHNDTYTVESEYQYTKEDHKIIIQGEDMACQNVLYDIEWVDFIENWKDLKMENILQIADISTSQKTVTVTLDMKPFEQGKTNYQSGYIEFEVEGIIPHITKATFFFDDDTFVVTKEQVQGKRNGKEFTFMIRENGYTYREDNLTIQKEGEGKYHIVSSGDTFTIEKASDSFTIISSNEMENIARVELTLTRASLQDSITCQKNGEFTWLNYFQKMNLFDWGMEE